MPLDPETCHYRTLFVYHNKHVVTFIKKSLIPRSCNGIIRPAI